MTCPAKAWTGEPSAPAATRASDSKSAQSVTPIVAGRRPTRRFKR